MSIRDLNSDIVFELEESTPNFDYWEIPANNPIILPKWDEATIEFNNVNLNRKFFWTLTYGRSWRWPVSNNWLKLNGYTLRRNKQIKKALPWFWKYLINVLEEQCHEIEV